MSKSQLFRVNPEKPMSFAFVNEDISLTENQREEVERKIKENGGLMRDPLYADKYVIRLANPMYKPPFDNKVFDINFVADCVKSNKIQNITKYLGERENLFRELQALWRGKNVYFHLQNIEEEENRLLEDLKNSAKKLCPNYETETNK